MKELPAVVVVRTLRDPATKWTHGVAEKFISAARQAGHVTEDCSHILATRCGLHEARERVKPSTGNLVLFYCNGSPDGKTLQGQCGHRPLLSLDNLDRLKGWGICALACCSGRVLGRQAVRRGARFYWGFTEEIHLVLLPRYARLLATILNFAPLELLRKWDRPEEAAVAFLRRLDREMTKIRGKPRGPEDLFFVASLNRLSRSFVLWTARETIGGQGGG